MLTGLKAPHESRPTRHTSPHSLSFLFFNKWRICTACWIYLNEMRKGARLAEHGFHASHLSLSTHGVAFGSIAAQTSAPSHQSGNGAVRSLSQQPCTLFCLLRHRLLGQKYGTESELA